MNALARRIRRLEQSIGGRDSVHICSAHPPDFNAMHKRGEYMQFELHEPGDPMPLFPTCGADVWRFTLDLQGAAAFDHPDD